MASRCSCSRTTPSRRYRLPAQVEGHRFVVDPGRVDALHRLGDDLGADAVPADDPDPVAHGLSSTGGSDNDGN